MLDLKKLHSYQENDRIEAKQALGGLPESIWETYSAFANAGGGVILLGVEEMPDKSFRALDLLDPHWLIEDFWRGMNDPDVVSVNILREEDVQIHTVEGKTIVTITVPPVSPSLGPVYVHQEGRWQAYIRRGEGDFRCTDAEIEEMYRKREESHG